jgi:hypothetical protein
MVEAAAPRRAGPVVDLTVLGARDLLLLHAG